MRKSLSVFQPTNVQPRSGLLTLKQSLLAALLCSVAFANAGCSDEDMPKTENSTQSETFPLVAKVVEFTDSIVTVEYTLSNNSDKPRIVFGVGAGLQSTLTDTGVRLFKGQYNPDVASATPLLITGQELAAGDSITEMSSRPLPLTIDYDFISGETHAFDDFEFCIGHSDPEDQRIAPEGEPNYFLTLFTENSRNECLMLTRP